MPAVVPDHSDERLRGRCIYCFGPPETREHIPSRVLLARPLPPDLYQAPACRACNESYSRDEEYVACVLECVLAGSTDPARIGRPEIARKLADRPGLRARIEAGRSEEDGQIAFDIEHARVENLIGKLAIGHAVYELAEFDRDLRLEVRYWPLPLLDDDQRRRFETPPGSHLLPEVGSRAMHRLFSGGCGWIEVQPGRYRYLATVGPPQTVRIVLVDYLACEVRWLDAPPTDSRILDDLGRHQSET